MKESGREIAIIVGLFKTGFYWNNMWKPCGRNMSRRSKNWWIGRKRIWEKAQVVFVAFGTTSACEGGNGGTETYGAGNGFNTAQNSLANSLQAFENLWERDQASYLM
jgi:hypothetical protein